MAQTARRRPAREEPPVDPSAIDRRYRLERAKRRARYARERRTQNAHVRFYAIMFLLFFVSVVVALTIWHQISKLFGI